VAQIGGGDPVLAFLRQEVVSDAKKAFDGNSDTHLFEGFAERAAFESLQIFQLAADDAPAACFGRPLAEREERPIAVVNDEHTDANPWKRAHFVVVVLRSHGSRGKRAQRWPRP
jgi:hypothetical protein